VDTHRYDEKFKVLIETFDRGNTHRTPFQLHWRLRLCEFSQFFINLKNEPYPERNNPECFKLLGLEYANLTTTRGFTGILSYLVQSELFWKNQSHGTTRQCTVNDVQEALYDKLVPNPLYPNKLECFGRNNCTENSPNFKFPSVLSTRFPIFLELKSGKGKSEREFYEDDADVILEAMGRVFSVARHNETLRRVVAFATTGVKSWIFMLVREFPELIYGKDKIVENYHLFPIDLGDIIPLWHHLNEKPADFFLHDDCFLLSDILSSTGYYLRYCQLRLLHRIVLGSHISAIYEVTPGGSENYVTVPTHCEENSFIIKLSLGSSRGNNEYEIIKKLCTENSIAVDYVFMGLRSETNSRRLSMFPADLKSFKQPHTSDGIELEKSRLGFTRFLRTVPGQLPHRSANCKSSLCWWNCSRSVGMIIPEFTAIFMHPGTVVEKLHPDEAVGLRVFMTTAIHNHGVLHCDPRKSNILRFKRWEEVEQVDATTKLVTKVRKLVERVRLIDFDLSILKENEGEMELTPGARTELLKTLGRFVKPVNRDGKLFVRMDTTLDSLMLGTVLEQIPRYQA
jgi:hypothetical protein